MPDKYTEIKYPYVPQYARDILNRGYRQNQDMIERHSPDCYAPKGQCISCGCNKKEQKPCVSHG